MGQYWVVFRSMEIKVIAKHRKLSGGFRKASQLVIKNINCLTSVSTMLLKGLSVCKVHTCKCSSTYKTLLVIELQIVLAIASLEFDIVILVYLMSISLCLCTYDR